jgi:hypothetical protein
VLPLFFSFVVLPVGTFVGCHLQQGSSARSRLHQAIAWIDQIDPNWRLEEIEATREVIPDKENGALVLQKAGSLMGRSWPAVGSSKAWTGHPPQVLLSGENLKILRTEVERVKTALTEALRVKDFPRGRFPLALTLNVGTTNRNRIVMHSVSDLLAAHVVLAANDGNWNDACDSCRAILNTGRAIGDEPFITSSLLRTRTRLMAVQGLEQTLAMGEPSEEALLLVKNLIERDLPEPVHLFGIRGGRDRIHDLSLKVEAEQLSLSELAPFAGAPERRRAWNAWKTCGSFRACSRGTRKSFMRSPTPPMPPSFPSRRKNACWRRSMRDESI